VIQEAGACGREDVIFGPSLRQVSGHIVLFGPMPNYLFGNHLDQGARAILDFGVQKPLIALYQ
jgi:hypothetical protein